MDEPGYDTPEEAVLAEFGAPRRFVNVVGVRERDPAALDLFFREFATRPVWQTPPQT
jgi:hypothetical protein